MYMGMFVCRYVCVYAQVCINPVNEWESEDNVISKSI